MWFVGTCSCFIFQQFFIYSRFTWIFLLKCQSFALSFFSAKPPYIWSIGIMLSLLQFISLINYQLHLWVFLYPYTCRFSINFSFNTLSLGWITLTQAFLPTDPRLSSSQQSMGLLLHNAILQCPKQPQWAALENPIHYCHLTGAYEITLPMADLWLS